MGGFLSHWETPMLRPKKFSSEVHFDPADTAPARRLLTVKVSNGETEYVLPWPCVRKSDGTWVSVKTGKPLAVEVVGWRPSQHLGNFNRAPWQRRGASA